MVVTPAPIAAEPAVAVPAVAVPAVIAPAVAAPAVAELVVVERAVAAPAVAAPAVAESAVVEPIVAVPVSAQFSRERQLADRLENWGLAILFFVMFPLVPILMEFLENREVKSGFYLLTTAVLIGGYVIGYNSRIFWFLYGIIFLFFIILDSRPAAAVSIALTLLIAVIGVQALERFMRHVVWAAPFPDWKASRDH
jgi:hypothetical protein